MSKYDEAITAQKTAHTVRAFLMSATRRNEDGCGGRDPKPCGTSCRSGWMSSVPVPLQR